MFPYRFLPGKQDVNPMSFLSVSVRVAFRAGLPLICGAILFAPLSGCGDSKTDAGTGGSAPGGSAPPSKSADSSTGSGSTLKIEGSDTLLPLAQKWVEEFKAKNSGANVSVTGGGSGQGITSLLNGTCDIADASRKIDTKETATAKAKKIDIVETAVARDGITIVVNPKNNIKSLSLEQLAGIYTGKINNWKEVGGSDLPISASGRETSSGTYKYFQEDVLKKQNYRSDMNSTPSNDAIAQSVSTTTGGIGYIGVSYANAFSDAGQVRIVPISFKAGAAPVMPTSENILSNKYPISRALYNYTSGQPTGLAKQYLDYVTSDAGQKVVTDLGYVPLKAAGADTAPAGNKTAGASGAKAADTKAGTTK